MSLTCLQTPHPQLHATLDDDGILELAINRPERKNALYGELYLFIEQALLEAEQAQTVNVVILRGYGADFSAGNDLGDFTNSAFSGIDAPPFRLLRALNSLNKPVIMAVRGVAIGIGTTMLLHADLAYCDSTTRFQMPFVSLGLSPEGAASLLLPRLAGYNKAAELLLLAELFNAAQAKEAGLVNAIIDEDVYAYARQKAQRLAALPQASLRATKALLKNNAPTSIENRINEEAAIFVERMQGADMQEAISAFKEKRAPNFKQFQ